MEYSQIKYGSLQADLLKFSPIIIGPATGAAKHGAGSPQAQKVMIQRYANFDLKKRKTQGQGNSRNQGLRSIRSDNPRSQIIRKISKPPPVCVFLNRNPSGLDLVGREIPIRITHGNAHNNPL